MKWGVRRTPEQLGHRKKGDYNIKTAFSDHREKWTDPVRDEIRVKGGYLEAGTEFYRVTETPNEGPGRKYVSITDFDRPTYRNNFSGYENTYRATKKMRIAGASDVLKCAILSDEKLAKTTVSELARRTYDYGDDPVEYFNKFFDTSMTMSDAVKTVSRMSPRKAERFLTLYTETYENSDLKDDTAYTRRFYANLKDAGFDGCIDLFDTYINWEEMEYPAIIINDDAYELVKTGDRERIY